MFYKMPGFEIETPRRLSVSEFLQVRRLAEAADASGTIQAGHLITVFSDSKHHRVMSLQEAVCLLVPKTKVKKEGEY